MVLLRGTITGITVTYNKHIKKQVEKISKKKPKREKKPRSDGGECLIEDWQQWGHLCRSETMFYLQRSSIKDFEIKIGDFNISKVSKYWILRTSKTKFYSIPLLIWSCEFDLIIHCHPPRERGGDNCQTPVLGIGLGVDFTLANNKNKNKNKNNNPHPNFPGWDGTRGLKFGIQT